MIPQCLDQGIGVIPWSPLARGSSPGTGPAQGRGARPLERPTRGARVPVQAGGDFDVVDRVVEVAGERGVPPAQVALAWLLHRPE